MFRSHLPSGRHAAAPCRRHSPDDEAGASAFPKGVEAPESDPSRAPHNGGARLTRNRPGTPAAGRQPFGRDVLCPLGAVTTARYGSSALAPRLGLRLPQSMLDVATTTYRPQSRCRAASARSASGQERMKLQAARSHGKTFSTKETATKFSTSSSPSRRARSRNRRHLFTSS